MEKDALMANFPSMASDTESHVRSTPPANRPVSLLTDNSSYSDYVIIEITRWVTVVHRIFTRCMVWCRCTSRASGPSDEEAVRGCENYYRSVIGFRPIQRWEKTFDCVVRELSPKRIRKGQWSVGHLIHCLTLSITVYCVHVTARCGALWCSHCSG